MKKINIFLLCGFLLLPNFLEASNKWGLKKPSTHIAKDLKVNQVASLDQKVSVALSCLTNSGDMEGYDSGFSADVLINCNKTCSVFGQNIGMGVGLNISGLNPNEGVDGGAVSMGSAGLFLSPQLSLPLDFSFGAGLGYGDPQVLSSFGFISFDVFYKLPFCDNLSVGLQYKNIADPADGEVGFSKISNMGIALKIDG